MSDLLSAPSSATFCTELPNPQHYDSCATSTIMSHYQRQLSRVTCPSACCPCLSGASVVPRAARADCRGYGAAEELSCGAGAVGGGHHRSTMQGPGRSQDSRRREAGGGVHRSTRDPRVRSQEEHRKHTGQHIEPKKEIKVEMGEKKELGFGDLCRFYHRNLRSERDDYSAHNVSIASHMCRDIST